jgi:molybdate transport repressor ModE-like protein
MCKNAQTGVKMNWDDLRLFLAVTRSGSISGAAKQLGVQHSTISRRIRQFENKLGARLLERKQSGYELTREGEHVKDAAINIEREILGIDGALKGIDSQLIGSLRVTAINNMASTVLMPMFAKFSKKHPLVQLEVVVSNMDASLAQRDADIAIRLTNTPPDTLIGKRAATVASTIYGSRTYVKQLHDKNMEPKWIGVNCCGFHKTWTKQAVTESVHNFISDDTLLTLAAIKEGLGVSILPCFMGDADPHLERYCEPDPSYNLGLWILLHPDLKHTARVLSFREHMISSIMRKKGVFEGRRPQNESQ